MSFYFVNDWNSFPSNSHTLFGKSVCHRLHTAGKIFFWTELELGNCSDVNLAVEQDNVSVYNQDVWGITTFKTAKQMKPWKGMV